MKNLLENEENIRSIIERRIEKCEDLKIPEKLINIYERLGVKYLKPDSGYVDDYEKYFNKIEFSTEKISDKKYNFVNFYFNESLSLNSFEKFLVKKKLKKLKKLKEYKISFNQLNLEYIKNYTEFPSEDDGNEIGKFFIRVDDRDVCCLEVRISGEYDSVYDHEIKSFEDDAWVDIFLQFSLLIEKAHNNIEQSDADKRTKLELEELKNDFKISDEEITQLKTKKDEELKKIDGVTVAGWAIWIFLVISLVIYIFNQ
jgi:hypothetical protein